MINSNHNGYWIVVMFTLGRSYGQCKLSLFDFKHKWSLRKLNVCSVNLICLFGSIAMLA